MLLPFAHERDILGSLAMVEKDLAWLRGVWGCSQSEHLWVRRRRAPDDQGVLQAEGDGGRSIEDLTVIVFAVDVHDMNAEPFATQEIITAGSSFRVCAAPAGRVIPNQPTT